MTLETEHDEHQPGEHLGRPLRADAERNRHRILAAAAEVFAQRGLEAGLDEIAKYAGVGTGTVYRRFPDKALLIDALFETQLDDLLALAEKALAMEDSWAGLVYFLERSSQMQQADRGLKELLFGGDSRCAGHSPGGRFAAKVDRLVPAITAITDRAKADGQLRADVCMSDLAVIQVMLNTVGTFAAAVQPQLWRRQLALLLDGLRTQRTGITELPVGPLTDAELAGICMPLTKPPL